MKTGEWHIRALFEGERKMEESQWKCEGAGQGSVSYHAVAEDWGDCRPHDQCAGEMLRRKHSGAMMAVLTKKLQRRLIHQQFVLVRPNSGKLQTIWESRVIGYKGGQPGFERIRRKFDFENTLSG